MFSSTFMTVLLVSTLVSSAPTKSLDATTLLNNGQEAQKLNVLFQTMKETDPCTNGDKACISGGVAACKNGTWAVSQGRCSTSQECFALPSVREAGTLVTCTSERNALSAFNATGATGGIFGSSDGNSTTITGDGGNNNGTNTSNDSNENGASNDRGKNTSVISTPSNPQATSTPISAEPSTVTITLTAQPTTFAPVTRTLSPQEASSVLSSLMASGATIIENPPSPTVIGTPTASAAATTTPVLAAQSSGSTSVNSTPITIRLTAAPNPTPVTGNKQLSSSAHGY